VLQHQSHCYPSTSAGSPWCPSDPKRHLLSDASHNLWITLREADHEFQHGGSEHRSFTLAHGAQEHSYFMSAFLEATACKLWSAHLHVLSREKNHGLSLVVLGMCTRLSSMAHTFEKVHRYGWLHQSSILSTSWKLMGEVGCVRSAIVLDRSTHRRKQLRKLWLSIDNIIGFPICLYCLRATCITCLVGQVAYHILGMA
jgi:hypothetical protein